MKVNVIAVSVLAALCALALKADSYSADVSTPEKRAALKARLWAHEGKVDVRLWPESVLGENAKKPPFVFLDKELAQSNLVIGEVVNPQFTFFPAKGQGAKPCVVVFPGGGYHVLGWNKEGTEIAAWLNRVGFSAAVLLYRTDNRDGALADAERTIGLLRQGAAKYGIDPKRVGVIGFSAGANLAVRVSTHWRRRAYARVDAADDESCRPDFMMPIYPWDLRERIDPATTQKSWKDSYEITAEYPIDAETPPSFTAQSIDDFCQIETAVGLDLALRKAGVDTTIRIYPNGGHGYGLRRLGRATDTWSDEAVAWLAKFLK